MWALSSSAGHIGESEGRAPRSHCLTVGMHVLWGQGSNSFWEGYRNTKSGFFSDAMGKALDWESNPDSSLASAALWPCDPEKSLEVPGPPYLL